MQDRPPNRAAGVAVFLAADPDRAPGALMHNLKHNKVLHQTNVIMTVQTVATPRVDDADRVRLKQLGPDFWRVTARWGYMETPNVPKALGLCRKLGLKFDIMSTSFFLGRRTVVPARHSGMPIWQDKLFVILSKNAATPTDFYGLPPGRVVEMGTQISI